MRKERDLNIIADKIKQMSLKGVTYVGIADKKINVGVLDDDSRINVLNSLPTNYLSIVDIRVTGNI